MSKWLKAMSNPKIWGAAGSFAVVPAVDTGDAGNFIEKALHLLIIGHMVYTAGLPLLGIDSRNEKVRLDLCE